MMIDSHVHTRRCGHAEGTVGEMVAAATDLGVVAITEHVPLPEGFDPDGCYAMRVGELEAHVAEVRQAQAGSGPLVLLGFEADWLGGVTPMLPTVLRYDPDVILGSVHFIDGWAFDDPDLIGEWDSRDVLAVWERYFQELIAAASSGAFDVMAHPDLVKKFGHLPNQADRQRLYEAAALALRDSGVAIEVSTAGLRKPCAELYPAADFLTACARAGVPATTGSDAHAPSEVGDRLDVAVAALQVAGYREVVYFKDRARVVVGL